MPWHISSIPNLQGKIFLITGANSGIGFETAKVLADKGAKVILACRNMEKGKQAVDSIKQASPMAEVSLMQLDLASLESVKQFSNSLKANTDHLDVLINNAGVMVPPLSRTAEGFELQFGTNHLGHFALTGALLPLLESAQNARVVVVSSLAHRIGKIHFNDLNFERGYSRWPAYAQSKLANLLFAKELQRRLEKQGSKVIAVAVHPGYTSTELQRNMLGNKWFNPVFGQTQKAGCLPTLYGATAPEIKGGDYIGPDGFFEIRGKPKKAYANKRSNDLKLADKLWKVSEELTQTAYL